MSFKSQNIKNTAGILIIILTRFDIEESTRAIIPKNTNNNKTDFKTTKFFFIIITSQQALDRRLYFPL